MSELLPLFTFENKIIHFHEDVALETFGNEDFANKKLHIVSVMGPSRTGKSFLMSYLTGGIENGEISGTFHAGHNRVTQGILIYRRPIQVEIDGEMNYVFFVDTQGVFDTQTSMAVSGWIAGLSLLISNVQIMNLMRNIEADSLSEIRRFTEFAAAFPQHRLAKSLLFLIRDASDCSVYGQTFLNQLWDNCSKSSDLAAMSEMIRKRFPEIGCITSPIASLQLQSAKRTHRIQENDRPILNTFDEVFQYVKERLSTDRSNVVSIEYCREATNFLYQTAPRITSSVQVMTEARIAVKIGEEVAEYERILQSASWEILETVHEEARRKALHRFEKVDVSGEKIEKMQREFLERIEPIKLEMSNRFEATEEERRQQVELSKLLAKGRNTIYEMVTLNEVLNFKRNGKLEALKEELISSASQKIAPSSETSLRKALEEDVANVASHRIGVHIDDFGYRISQELQNEIENGSYSSIPTVNDLGELMERKLHRASKELETIVTTLGTSYETMDLLYQKLKRQLNETLQRTYRSLVDRLERQKQFEIHQQRHNEAVKKLESEAKIRKEEQMARAAEKEQKRAAEKKEQAQSTVCCGLSPTLPRLDCYYEVDKRRKEERRKQIEKEKANLELDMRELERELELRDKHQREEKRESDRILNERLEKMRSEKAKIGEEMTRLQRGFVEEEQKWEAKQRAKAAEEESEGNRAEAEDELLKEKIESQRQANEARQQARYGDEKELRQQIKDDIAYRSEIQKRELMVYQEKIQRRDEEIQGELDAKKRKATAEFLLEEEERRQRNESLEDRRREKQAREIGKLEKSQQSQPSTSIKPVSPRLSELREQEIEKDDAELGFESAKVDFMNEVRRKIELHRKEPGHLRELLEISLRNWNRDLRDLYRNKLAEWEPEMKRYVEMELDRIEKNPVVSDKKVDGSLSLKIKRLLLAVVFTSSAYWLYSIVQGGKHPFDFVVRSKCLSALSSFIFQTPIISKAPQIPLATTCPIERPFLQFSKKLGTHSLESIQTWYEQLGLADF